MRRQELSNMARRAVLVFFAASTAMVASAAPSAIREPVGREQRIAAQKAIEAVYWRHRIWPEQNPGVKPPLKSVLEESQIEARVEEALKKSNALAVFWKRPITSEELDAEVRRMARESRDPETLGELFAALNDDPRLIAECLARPVLADALVRRWYEADRRLGTAPGRAAKLSFEGWWRETAPTMSSSLIAAAGATRATATPAITAAACPPDSWAATRFLPDARAGQVAVWTGSEMLIWGAITYGDGSIPGGRYDPATDSWRPLSSINHPDARTGMKAVWTGTEMIVWGGTGGHSGCCVQLESGGRYDPQTDSWRPTSIGPGVPGSRSGHSAVWTGAEMIVWGGDVNGFGNVNNGGRYNPVTDTWAPTPTSGAPSPRAGHDAVWAGSRMVVWGGGVRTGGRYDPATNTWSPTSLTNAPEARSMDTAVSTGSKMIVWGGCGTVSGCFSPLETGATYDPAADTWTPATIAGAPAGRYDLTSVWTGSKMIVWGGCANAQCSTQFFDGGRYDPTGDAWAAVDVTTSPSQRAGHSAVWTGREMIVWGGCYGGECQLVLNTGGRYDPMTDSWVPTSTENAASSRVAHTAVWTGAEMIVWGGHINAGQTSSGKRYDPATDHWTMTNILTAALARENHTAVWTGSEMIVWGGNVQGMGPNNGGGRYNPTTDSWVDVGFAGAPDSRQYHTAIWTGSRMIVWGGMADYFGNLPLNTGGLYDPSTDTWRATSVVGAPAARWLHPAVWSGTEMFVWGGRLQSGAPTNSGARYDPVTDTWSATSTAGAPTAREAHAAVWDGTGVIVWGGEDAVNVLGDGARYAPTTNSWTRIAAAGAPEARAQHKFVWAGDRMLVWGGCANRACDTTRFTGGQYLPSTDSWMAISSGAFTPFDRYGHTAVWSGSRMIVWGGEDAGGTWTNTGSAYCPGPGGGPTLTPESPSDLAATPVSSSRVDLGWTGNSTNESSFKIERCRGTLAADCTWNPYNFYWIGSVPAGVTTYSDVTRAPNITYTYRVRASNTGGDSGFTNSIEATTLDRAPLAPTGLGATAASSTRVNLTWNDNSSNEQGFTVERCMGTAAFCDGNPSYFGQIGASAASVSSYADLNARANTTYSYRVRAFNAGGSSGNSNPASAATPGSGAGTPGEPSEIEMGRAPLLVTSYNKSTGAVTVSYAPACAVTDHAAYSGPLAQVSLLQWNLASCHLGTTGSATFDPGTGSRYFVIVGQSASAEGSYGRKSDGSERPEAVGVGSCDEPQNMTSPCP
jgi:N-acetylneuraminic acid mutarotase